MTKPQKIEGGKKLKKSVLIGKKHSNGKDEWWCEWFTCPNCKATSIYPKANYCSECGLKLRWLKNIKFD